MRRGIFLVVALAASSLLLTDTLDAQERMEETLVYEVRWGPSKVAALRLQSGCSNARYRPVQLRAKSVGLAEQIHAFDIRLDSFVGPNAQSLQGRTSIEEEGQRRTFKTTFNGAKSSVTKNIENKTTTGLVELPNATHDLLSWMLHLRNQQLAPQTTYRFKVWDGWKLVQITARIGVAEKKWVQDKAEIALPARLSRVRISPTGPSSSPKRAKTEDLGTIWFADTPGHRPIAMSFLAPLRNADIQLKQTLTKTCPTDR